MRSLSSVARIESLLSNATLLLHHLPHVSHSLAFQAEEDSSAARGISQSAAGVLSLAQAAPDQLAHAEQHNTVLSLLVEAQRCPISRLQWAMGTSVCSLVAYEHLKL